jgi:hypothetical protein
MKGSITRSRARHKMITRSKAKILCQKLESGLQSKENGAINKDRHTYHTVEDVEKDRLESKRPRLVGLNQATTTSPEVKGPRHRLASKLLVLKLDPPNTLELLEVIQLVESLLSEDTKHMMCLYRVSLRYFKYEDILCLWLRCAEEMLKFYKVTNFKGTLSTRDDWVKSHAKSLPADVRYNYIHTRASVYNWCQEHQQNSIANEAASVLFDMVSSGSGTGLDEIKCQILNKILFAWFK